MTLNVGPIAADVAASMVADLAGVGLIVPAKGGAAEVVCVGTDVPAERIFRTIAETAGWRVEFVDGLVRFKVDSKDAGGDVIVSLPSGYLDPEKVVESLNVLLGASRARRVGDRVIVSIDSPDVAKVRRWVSLAYEAPASWRIDVRVVTLTRSAFREFGLSGRGDLAVQSTGELNAGPGNGGASAVLVGSIGAKLAGSVASGRFDGRLESDSTLYVLEGRRGELHAGQSIPIPRRSVSAEGTVSDVGYDIVQSGLTLGAELQAVESGALLKLEAELSDVVGLVGGVYPQLATRSTRSEVVVRSGDWVVVTGLGEVSASDDTAGLFLSSALGASTARGERRTLVILVRATRLPSVELRGGVESGGSKGEREGPRLSPPSVSGGSISTRTNNFLTVKPASAGGSMRSTPPATAFFPWASRPSSAGSLQGGSGK